MVTKQEVLDFYGYLANNWLGIDNECALGRLVRSDRKIEKYAEKPQNKWNSPRIWRTIYVSYRAGQRYNGPKS